VRLCSRGRAGFALTDKGAIIYREAQRLFGAMDEFVSNAGAVKGRTTGTLRIGLVDCTVTDPNAPIAGAIQRFNRRENDVRIELSIAAPTALQRNVLERRLHLAIASFPVEISALTAEPLYDEINSFYCGAGHPLFAKADVTLEDIQAGRIVARSYWRGADLSRIGVEREAAAVEIMEAQATLILSGGYLGFLPEHYAAPWVADGQLRHLLPERLSYVAPFSMIVRRSVAEQQVVRQFIEDLRASLPTARVPQIGARMSTHPRSRRTARAKPRPIEPVAARG